MKNTMVSILFLLAVIFIALSFYRRYSLDRIGKEGFTQKEVFTLKEGNDKYDEFYSEIYDTLNLCDKRADNETMQVIQMTMPNPKHSVFLDVGSGTGDLVNRIQEEGYRVYGIDKSSAMCKRAISKHGKIPVKQGDVLVSMNFERNTFSHITCLYYTIYEIQDRRQFFKNAYFWLMPGGYLILHLVDPKEFDYIVPSGRPSVVDNIQKYANRRITDTIIDFTGYTYKANLQSPNSDSTGQEDAVYIVKEEFRDKSTGYVRQNEQMLYMNSIEDILLEAIKCGFLIKGKAEMSSVQDKYQYMYILERTL